MYCDTHAHFDGAATATAWMTRARAAGVTRVLAVGGSAALNAGACAAAQSQPESVRLALGLDRSQCGDPDAVAAFCTRYAAWQPRLRALGEMGLDYHHDPQTRREQCVLLERLLSLAEAWRQPVIVHTRDADDDTLALLRTYAQSPWARQGRPGVVHCFTGGAAFATALLELGFHISFSGIVTFRNADALREVARLVPAERLLIETDAPFLTPVPLRGQPNEPAFVVRVAECLARVRGLPVGELARQTTVNAEQLFGAW